MNISNQLVDVQFTLLGQSGCKFSFRDTVIYIDLYLSNSVQKLDADDLKRLIEIPVLPENVTDADWVVLTHDHIDHCDPETIPILAKASPQANFMGPVNVLKKLMGWGIDRSRLFLAQEEWIELSSNVRVFTVPAAHLEVERNAEGALACVGYVFDFMGSRLYVAGDTCVDPELVESLGALKPIGAAILPVNEHNYFREKRGIVGNMSPREAFLFAEDLGVNLVVPVHWDMFAVNSVSPEEIEAVYHHMKPSFELAFNPDFLRI